MRDWKKGERGGGRDQKYRDLRDRGGQVGKKPEDEGRESRF